MPDPFRTRLLARMARETEGLDQTYLAGARAALEEASVEAIQRTEDDEGMPHLWADELAEMAKLIRP